MPDGLSVHSERGIAFAGAGNPRPEDEGHRSERIVPAARGLAVRFHGTGSPTRLPNSCSRLLTACRSGAESPSGARGWWPTRGATRLRSPGSASPRPGGNTGAGLRDNLRFEVGRNRCRTVAAHGPALREVAENFEPTTRSSTVTRLRSVRSSAGILTGSASSPTFCR